jgi:hypothetical protein
MRSIKYVLYFWQSGNNLQYHENLLELRMAELRLVAALTNSESEVLLMQESTSYHMRYCKRKRRSADYRKSLELISMPIIWFLVNPLSNSVCCSTGAYQEIRGRYSVN